MKCFGIFFQFLDKTLQQELQRIKSSTMRQKKEQQQQQQHAKQDSSYMRTITDRFSDAKVNFKCSVCKHHSLEIKAIFENISIT